MSTQLPPTVKKECEGRHAFYGVACSGEAVFVLHRHGMSHLICKAGAQRIFAMSRSRCYSCRQVIWKHWDLEPIR
jgi:hypothetical protein